MQRPSHKTQRVTGSRVKTDQLRMKSGEPTLVLSKEKGKIGTDEAYLMKGVKSWDWDQTGGQKSRQPAEDAPSTPTSSPNDVYRVGTHPSPSPISRPRYPAGGAAAY